MQRLPDFEGWAMFAKVVEDRSYAAAARHLSVSVATVSRAVKRLEDRLGGRLFNRTSRQIALTPLGERMAETAQQILNEAERAENDARELSTTPRGLIRLAVPMSFGVRWVAELLPKFLQEYPDISIDLHLSDTAVDLVGDGFDAALRIAIMQDSSLIARKFCPVHRYIVAAPSYVKKYGQPQHPDDLKAHHCLSYAYRARSSSWTFMSKNGKEASITPTGPLRVTNIEAAIPTILAGHAIAELPDFLAAKYIKNGKLVVLLQNWTMPFGALYFVTPSSYARPAKIEALSNFFAKHLSQPLW